MFCPVNNDRLTPPVKLSRPSNPAVGHETGEHGIMRKVKLLVRQHGVHDLDAHVEVVFQSPCHRLVEIDGTGEGFLVFLQEIQVARDTRLDFLLG